jgi:hypothetical protein
MICAWWQWGFVCEGGREEGRKEGWISCHLSTGLDKQNTHNKNPRHPPPPGNQSFLRDAPILDFIPYSYSPGPRARGVFRNENRLYPRGAHITASSNDEYRTCLVAQRSVERIAHKRGKQGAHSRRWMRLCVCRTDQCCAGLSLRPAWYAIS